MAACPHGELAEKTYGWMTGVVVQLWHPYCPGIIPSFPGSYIPRVLCSQAMCVSWYKLTLSVIGKGYLRSSKCKRLMGNGCFKMQFECYKSGCKFEDMLRSITSVRYKLWVISTEHFTLEKNLAENIKLLKCLLNVSYWDIELGNIEAKV